MGLNQIICTSNIGNTGIGSCAFIPKTIKGFFIVPLSFVISATNAATPEALQAFLENAAKNPTKSARIFPVHNFIGFTDASEEAVSETAGYGDIIPLRDGNYNWTFRFMKGGLCLANQLRKFQDQNLAVIFYDSDGALLGRNSTAGLMGVPLTSLFVPKFGLNDGSVAANFSVTVAHDPKHLNQNGGFYKNDNFDPSAILGLQDIILTAVGVQSTTVLQVAAVQGCEGANLYDLFSGELADGELWEATDAVTGLPLTITAVATLPGVKGFSITLSVARVNDTVVNLAPVDVLEDADILQFEGSPVTIPLA